MDYFFLDFLFKNKTQHLLILLLFFALFKSLFLAFMLYSILLIIIYTLKAPNKNIGEPFLFNNRPSVYAHRGAGHDAPENTLEAVKLAKRNGADGIEFDIDFTSDNVAVVIHDDTVDRTTNGHGKVHDFTFEEIRKLHTSQENSEFQIPTLDEMVTLCLSLNLKMFIDVKEYRRIDKVIKTMNNLYEKHPSLYNMAIVCSFYPHIVYLLKIKNNKIMTGLTHRPNFITKKVDGSDNKERSSRYIIIICSILDVILEWCHKTFLWYLCQNHLYLMFHEVISHDEIAFMKDRQIEVIVWTVNDKHCQDYISMFLMTSYMTDTMSNKELTM